MGLHASVEYLKYLSRAFSRHGVHSPFVYNFIETVLRDKNIIDKTFIVECPAIPLKYENLISRTAARYRCRHVMRIDGNTGINAAADMLLIDGPKPNEWAGLVKQSTHLPNGEGAVVITGIHKNAACTRAWKMICADAQVPLSIDVYGIGLLFFRKEFRTKQHFILRY